MATAPRPQGQSWTQALLWIQLLVDREQTPSLLSASGGLTCAAKGNVSPCLRAEVSAKERKRRVSLRIEGSSPLEIHGSQALLLFPLALSPQPPTARPRAMLLGGEHCKRSPCPALEGFQHCHIRRNSGSAFCQLCDPK